MLPDTFYRTITGAIITDYALKRSVSLSLEASTATIEMMFPVPVQYNYRNNRHDYSSDFIIIDNKSSKSIIIDLRKANKLKKYNHA
jgi:hypothetical protein